MPIKTANLTEILKFSHKHNRSEIYHKSLALSSKLNFLEFSD